MPSNKVAGSTVRTATAPVSPALGSGPAFVGGLTNHINDPVDAHAASAISYAGGPTWADGTTNPASDVQAQLDKIISDLGQSTSGADKITFDPTSAGGWADGAPYTATTIQEALDQIQNELGSAFIPGMAYIGVAAHVSTGSFGSTLGGSGWVLVQNILNNAAHLSNDNTFSGNITLDQNAGASSQLVFSNPTDYFRIQSLNVDTRWDIGTGHFILQNSGTDLWAYNASGDNITNHADLEVWNNTNPIEISFASTEVRHKLGATFWTWGVSEGFDNVLLGVQNAVSPATAGVDINVPNVRIDGDILETLWGGGPRNLTWRHSTSTSVGATDGGQWTIWAQGGAPQSGAFDNNDGGGIRLYTGPAGTGGSGAEGRTGPFILQMDPTAQVRHYYFVDKGVDNTDLNVVWEDPLGDLAVGETVYIVGRRIAVVSTDSGGTVPSGTGSANAAFEAANFYMYWTRNSTSINNGSNPPDTDIQGNPIYDQETNHSFNGNTPQIEVEYQGNAAGDVPTGLRDVHFYITVFRVKD